MEISKHSQTLILEELSEPRLKLVMQVINSIATTTKYLGKMVLEF